MLVRARNDEPGPATSQGAWWWLEVTQQGSRPNAVACLDVRGLAMDESEGTKDRFEHFHVCVHCGSAFRREEYNYRKRVLHRFAQELELPKLTFQVIRRTVATLARKKGDIKDVQGVLRHSRTATTTDVYMQELPEGVRATVNSIHQELTRKGGGTGDEGPGPS